MKTRVVTPLTTNMQFTILWSPLVSRILLYCKEGKGNNSAWNLTSMYIRVVRNQPNSYSSSKKQ